LALTDTQIRNAKKKEKPYKLADGGGLYLEAKPNGSKLWRVRYRLAGKENVFAIGGYPEVSLTAARAARDEAKKLIKQGVHPSHHRKLDRIRTASEHANSFQAVALEWLEKNAKDWEPKTLQQRERGLERDVFPYVGSLPIRQVTPAHVLKIIQRIEKRAPAMAVLISQAIGAICRYAVVTLRADSDPTYPLRGSLKTPATKHHKLLSRSQFPAFLKATEAYPGYFSNKAALQLALLTLCRTNEALQAKWSEFDFEHNLWRIPAERMKMREPHTIPLSQQAVELLTGLHVITGNGEYLFPNRSNLKRPVSHGVLWKAVASMGYTGKFSPHGIRATGSTILNEMGFRPDVIERQLAHEERNKSRGSYNRAEYLDERRKMMQQWADYVDSLTKGEKVIGEVLNLLEI
jgi:integrase